MHALADYGVMHVKLYQDIARLGQVAISYDYPVMVNGRHLTAPSPIPAFDNPKLHMMPALQLFGAVARSASTPSRPILRCARWISRTTRSAPAVRRTLARCAGRTIPIWTRSWWIIAGGEFSSVPIPITVRRRQADGHVGAQGLPKAAE